jgi:tetratricopeptide (TPR) repeat protein
LLIVQGSIGIGKTSLVTAFLGQYVIDQGRLAVAGRCNPAGIPYTPFAEILATILGQRLSPSTTTDQVEMLLGHIPGLARLLNLGRAGQISSSSEYEDSQTAQWQFFTTLLAILAELGPTVIFLEDATFLDEASIALTQFLIRQPQLPLLLIAAYRTGSEQGSAWLDLFSSTEKEIVSLPPLSTAGIRIVLENLLNGPLPERLVSLVKQRSQGVPLHIEEVARQLIDIGELKQAEDGQWRYRPATKPMETPVSFLPKSVFNVFARRLRKLSEKSREALALAALIEPSAEFDFEVWVEILGGESQQSFAQGVIDEAIAERVARQVGDRRYSLHPVDLASALTNDFPQAEAQRYHRQLAEILRRKAANPTLIGYHYEQAWLENEAVYFLEIAAAEAAAANAVKTAIETYNRVVELKESVTAYKALGRLYRQQGDWDNSLIALQQAYELATAANDVTTQAQILNGLSFTLWLYDDYREAYEAAAAVLELAEAPETELATAQSHLGMISWLVGELSEAEDWCQKSVQLLEQRDDEASLAGAYNRLGLVHFSQGKLSAARQAAERSLALREKLGDFWGHAFSLTNLGKIAAAQGDFEQAFSLFNSAQKLFEQVNSQDGLMILSTSFGWALCYQARYEEALAWLAKAEQLAVKIGKHTAYGLSYIYLLEARARLALGEPERARSLTNDAFELVQAAENREYIALALANLAEIYAVEGKPVVAEEMFQRSLALFEQVGSQTGLLETRLNYARFLARQGQTERATKLEQESRAEAARIGVYLP